MFSIKKEEFKRMNSELEEISKKLTNISERVYDLERAEEKRHIVREFVDSNFNPIGGYRLDFGVRELDTGHVVLCVGDVSVELDKKNVENLKRFLEKKRQKRGRES